MSNKTLVIVIIILFVLIGGGWYLYQSQQSKTVEGTSTDTSQQTPATTDQSQVQDTNQASTTSTNASTTPTTMTDCQKDFNQAKLAANSGLNIKNRQVTINVKGFGNITVELYDQDAPKTVENFLRLTDSGFYDCLTFHRIAKNFVIQGGDPSGNGSGGLSAYGGAFADELNTSTPSYKAGYIKGVLAMANSGPNTNQSQFFIMLADTQLPHNYTIFGKVIAGQDVVDKIGAVDINPGPFGPTDGSPVTPVVMQRVTITK